MNVLICSGNLIETVFALVYDIILHNAACKYYLNVVLSYSIVFIHKTK